MLGLITVLSFFTILMFLYPILKYMFVKQKSVYRLSKYTNIDEAKEEKKKTAHRDYRTGLNIISRKIGNLRFLDGYKKQIQFQLVRAHVLLKSEEYISICMILFLISGAIVFLFTENFTFSIAAAIAGWLIPTLIIKFKIKKRTKHLNDQLCDAIILISNSLKAGYSFFQAVDIVVKEMEGPISEEFHVMQKEINLGLTTEKALENLVNRVSSNDLELVVTAVMIQRQVGGNLSEVLYNISSTIRERVKIKGEVRTLTAQGRMSGLIISLLPVGLGIILYMINPEHIGILFKDPIGIAIIVFSIIMELIGIYFISRVVKIEI